MRNATTHNVIYYLGGQLCAMKGHILKYEKVNRILLVAAVFT
jgi:hypothetical protein